MTQYLLWGVIIDQDSLPPIATSDFCQAKPIIDSKIRNMQERLVLGCRSAHRGGPHGFD